MKINEIVDSIFASNEEQELLNKLTSAVVWESLSDREQLLANSLVRKSLLRKFRDGKNVMVQNAKTSS